MGIDSTLGNVRTLIENEIVDEILFAYGHRLANPVADVPTLRSTPSASIPQRSMVFVTANGFAWKWDGTSLSADDGANVVQPNDVASGLPGRWLRQTTTGQTSTASMGYLLRADLYNDDSEDIAIFMERLFGQAPSVMLSFDGIDREPKSTEIGALDWCKAHFTLFAISFNARGFQAARQGSPVPSEAAVDPGTSSILGDVKTLLKGSTLGLNDVAYVSIGREYPVVRDLARARIVDALEITVFYTETLPDPSAVPLSAPYYFNVNYKLADVNQAGVLDASNEATSAGLQFALGNSLTQAFAGGTINFNGQPVTIAGASNTFQANAVTYRDVDSTGALYYSTTNFGDPQPALAVGRLRLGVTFADATGVRADRLLISSLVSFGPTDEITPPLSSIALSPTSITVPHGTPLLFTAIGTYADGTTADITSQCTWSSDNTSVATISGGLATTLAAGTAHITASLSGVTSPAATLTAT